MEEKERYVIVGDIIAKDRKNDNCFGIVHAVNELNYQDREIDRLEKMLYTTTKHADKLNEENNKLKQEVNDWKQRFNSRDKWCKTLLQNSVTVSELKNKKIEQLKQAQKQLAISELEKALVLVRNVVNLESPEYDLVYLYDAIVDQIKSLKGEQ